MNTNPLNEYVGNGRGYLVCAVPHCTEPHKAKRLCADHYLVWYRARQKTGYIHPRVTLDQLENAVTKSNDTCNMDECHNTTHARGLCMKHYSQFNRLKKEQK